LNGHLLPLEVAYTYVNRVGRTSITLNVEALVQRYLSDLMER
jgi:acyl-CoA hydrolase